VSNGANRIRPKQQDPESSDEKQAEKKETLKHGYGRLLTSLSWFRSFFNPYLTFIKKRLHVRFLFGILLEAQFLLIARFLLK
jgi:hypothetical protein